jgi:uncharacterized membrane protein YesL
MMNFSKKQIIGGSLVLGGIFLYVKYGTQPRITGEKVDFQNFPAKLLSGAVIASGLYMLYKNKNK